MAGKKTRWRLLSRRLTWAVLPGALLGAVLSMPLWASEGPEDSDMAGLLEAAWVLDQAPMAAVAADNPIELTLGYRFYGGGFQLAEMDMETLLSSDAYDLSARLQTVGLANLLFPGKVDLRAYGPTESEDDLRAYAYVIESRSGERSVAIAGTGEAGYEAVMVPHREPEHALATARTRGTLDPLAAVAMGIFRAAGAPCADGMEVFDGSKVLEVGFSDVAEEWTGSRLGMFEGETVRCRIGYRAVAGVDPAEESREKRPPITIWLARLPGVLDGEDILVPVRVQAEVLHFDAVVHLVSARLNGEALSDWPG